jgi:hypothetical protein
MRLPGVGGAAGCVSMSLATQRVHPLRGEALIVGPKAAWFLVGPPPSTDTSDGSPESTGCRHCSCGPECQHHAPFGSFPSHVCGGCGRLDEECVCEDEE